ncbi:MAG: cobyrinate a,c-diamide synthase [Chlorobium sp.]|nr:cobyrinate a,c-diamide synthase [Chlorobium sp.]
MISAPHKSAGKTTVTLGLLRYFANQGMTVSSFKKGPDYIDPEWHRLASRAECSNLDPWLMGKEGCLELFQAKSVGRTTSLALIEGNHGLHDGISLDGSDSSAGLARMLEAPVVLVVDSRKMNRGIAALIMGMQAMTPRADIRGVILNQVKSVRHAEKQTHAIEHYCGVPVLGVIPGDKELVLAERHLGLTTVAETAEAEKFIQAAAERVERYCDMAALLALFHEAPPMEVRRQGSSGKQVPARAKIGVFKDAAFCFYYPENLEALRKSGAEICFINSFQESSLPDVDALYLGGGFPESFFEVLSSNKGLLGDVREKIEGDMPVYAECGGLIYLCRDATWEGKSYQLAGVLPFEITFDQTPAGHGYVDLKSREDSPWFKKGECVKAHEFHYSRVLLPAIDHSFQFDVIRGYGITGKSDGALYRNVFASFAHLHALANPHWAETFVSLASAYKAREQR